MPIAFLRLTPSPRSDAPQLCCLRVVSFSYDPLPYLDWSVTNIDGVPEIPELTSAPLNLSPSEDKTFFFLVFPYSGVPVMKVFVNLYLTAAVTTLDKHPSTASSRPTSLSLWS